MFEVASVRGGKPGSNRGKYVRGCAGEKRKRRRLERTVTGKGEGGSGKDGHRDKERHEGAGRPERPVFGGRDFGVGFQHAEGFCLGIADEICGIAIAEEAIGDSVPGDGGEDAAGQGWCDQDQG